LAGVPEVVVARARELLDIFSRERLKGEDTSRSTAPPENEDAISLFSESPSTASVGNEPHPIIETLKAMDVDNLTPLEALVHLQDLRREALKSA